MTKQINLNNLKISKTINNLKFSKSMKILIICLNMNKNKFKLIENSYIILDII